MCGGEKKDVKESHVRFMAIRNNRVPASVTEIK